DPDRISQKSGPDPTRSESEKIISRSSNPISAIFFCWIELVVLVTTKKDRRNRTGRSRDNRKKRFSHSRSILVTPYHGSIRSRSEERRVGKEWRSGGGRTEESKRWRVEEMKRKVE